MMNAASLLHLKISHVLKFNTILGFNENMNHTTKLNNILLLYESENSDSNIDKYKTKPCTYVNVKKYYIC